MITDTAPFRYPHYHKITDTPDKIDYNRMARVVAGFAKVIEDLASPIANSDAPGKWNPSVCFGCQQATAAKQVTERYSY